MLKTNYEEFFKETLPLFSELTNPSGTSYTAREYSELLTKASQKDYSGFSIALTLECMLQSFLKNQDVKLVDLIMERREDVMKTISLSNQILDNFTASNYYEDKKIMETKVSEFVKVVYNRDKLNVKELFTIGEKLFKILEEHFKTLDKMELHQFKKGKSSPEKPVFFNRINCFKTLDQALNVLLTCKSNFIALVGIRDEDSQDNGYFAYISRNGENLYVYTDVKRNHDIRWNGSFNDMQSTRSLMPYVALGEFQYVWQIFDPFLDKYVDINTDKYYVGLNNRDFQTFTFNELEPNEIMLQYFMFEYMNYQFFEKHFDVPQLSYTTQNIALTYKDKTLYKKAVPVPYDNNLEKTEIKLLTPLEKLEELYQDLLTDQIEYQKHIQRKETDPEYRNYFNGKTSFTQMYDLRKCDIDTIFDNVKNSLTKLEGINILEFEGEKPFTAIDYKGDVRDVKMSDDFFRRNDTPHSSELLKISKGFFGTEDQNNEYMAKLIQKNLESLIVKEYSRLSSKYAETAIKFFNHLFSNVYRKQVVERILLNAITDQDLFQIKTPSYEFEYRTRWSSDCKTYEVKSYEDKRYNMWDHYQRDSRCELNDTKSVSYKLTGNFNSIHTLRYLFDLEDEELPEYFAFSKKKIDYDHFRNKNIKLNINDSFLFHVWNGHLDALFWISERGLKSFCKEHNINIDEAKAKIEVFTPK